MNMMGSVGISPMGKLLDNILNAQVNDAELPERFIETAERWEQFQEQYRNADPDDRPEIIANMRTQMDQDMSDYLAYIRENEQTVMEKLIESDPDFATKMMDQLKSLTQPKDVDNIEPLFEGKDQSANQFKDDYYEASVEERREMMDDLAHRLYEKVEQEPGSNFSIELAKTDLAMFNRLMPTIVEADERADHYREVFNNASPEEQRMMIEHTREMLNEINLFGFGGRESADETEVNTPSWMGSPPDGNNQEMADHLAESISGNIKAQLPEGGLTALADYLMENKEKIADQIPRHSLEQGRPDNTARMQEMMANIRASQLEMIDKVVGSTSTQSQPQSQSEATIPAGPPPDQTTEPADQAGTDQNVEAKTEAEPPPQPEPTQAPEPDAQEQTPQELASEPEPNTEAETRQETEDPLEAGTPTAEEKAEEQSGDISTDHGIEKAALSDAAQKLVDESETEGLSENIEPETVLQNAQKTADLLERSEEREQDQEQAVKSGDYDAALERAQKREEDAREAVDTGGWMSLSDEDFDLQDAHKDVANLDAAQHHRESAKADTAASQDYQDEGDYDTGAALGSAAAAHDIDSKDYAEDTEPDQPEEDVQSDG